MVEPGQRIEQALAELGAIVTRLVSDQDVSRYQNDLDRWKARTVEALTDFVPAQDLAAFRHLSTRPNWVQMEDPVGPVLDRHRAYLESLAHDIREHPDTYRDRVTRERAPKRSAKPTKDAATLALPEKVTLAWLFSHVPVHLWIVLAGTLLAAFASGVALGSIPEIARFVAPALGVEISSPAP